MATSTAAEILKRASTVNPETTLDVPPSEIAKHAKPAPGAAPHGSFAYLTAADGTEAWIVKGDQGQVVGYLRDASQPERAIEIADPAVWAKVVDSLGLTEHAVPLPPVEQAPPQDPTLDPTQPPADPADPAAAPGAANPAAAPAPPHQAPPHAAPPFQRKDAEDGVAESEEAENGVDSGQSGDFEGKDASLDGSGSSGGAAAPADDEEQDGIMIAFVVPEGDAADLALDHPTALPPSQLHLTLAYLGSTTEVADDGAYYADVLEALRDVAAEYDPVTANVSGVGRFSIPGDADAFYYSVDAPELPELRQAIVDALEDNGLDVSHEHGFTPHITACYLKEGEDNPLRRAESKTLNFDALVFCFGDQRLSIRLDGQDPEEEEDLLAPQIAGVTGYVDSTAPSAMPDRKALPPQFRRSKNGKNKVGKKGGPPIATGSWVSWGNQRGRVDLVVTNGTVPGVEEDITGTADKPAARVVVYTQGDGGKWTATGKKVGVSASSLKRTAPLTGGFGKKALDLADPEAALVEVLTGYYETADTKEYGTVDPVAVRTVYERGLLSWPGEHTAVPNEAWALGRTKAFLTVAAGGEVKGYDTDLDLLPAEHPLAVVDTSGPELVLSPETEQAAEEKVAVTITEGERIDSETVQATINELLRFARPSA